MSLQNLTCCVACLTPLLQFLMEREKKRFGVGIEAPDMPLWSDDELRTFRVQVDPQFLPLRKATDLLCVLNKARAIPGVDEVLLVQLNKWCERDGISVEKIDCFCQFEWRRRCIHCERFT